MYMSLYPMIGFHVRKGFCIGIQAAWKYCNKYILKIYAISCFNSPNIIFLLYFGANTI